MKTADIFKILAVLVLLVLAGGFIFRILFKLGILALIVLGILYLFTKVFGKRS